MSSVSCGRSGPGSQPWGPGPVCCPSSLFQPGPLTTWEALALATGLAGRAGVVVGEGACGRAEVEVQRLDRHGGVGRRHAGVRLLGLQLSRWVPGQHAVLYALRRKRRGGLEDEQPQRPARSGPGSCSGTPLLCDLGQATACAGPSSPSWGVFHELPRLRFKPGTSPPTSCRTRGSWETPIPGPSLLRRVERRGELGGAPKGEPCGSALPIPHPAAEGLGSRCLCVWWGSLQQLGAGPPQLAGKTDPPFPG